MEPIFGRCGYRCDLCLAYGPNIEEDPSTRQKVSDGWYRYYGFRLAPSEICCDGCRCDSPKLIDKHCPVRPCVIEKGLDNCSQCEDYVCEKLTERLVAYEDVKRRVGMDIPEDDYLCFIRPFENKRRLDELRAALGP